MPNTLSYEIQTQDGQGFFIQPLIDGKPFQDFCPKGIDTNYLIDGSQIQQTHARTVFHAPIGPYTEEALVFICSCGEWGCASNSVTMQVDDLTVTWSKFKTHPHQPESFEGDIEPLIFDRPQYESVCESIHAAYLKQCMEHLATVLRPLEQSHLDPATRSDPDAMAALLHPDFIEIGASGRTYNRDDTLALLKAETVNPTYIISDFTVHPIPSRDAHCRIARTQYTITATTADSTQRTSRRTTIWQNNLLAGKWHMLFHQGTLVA